MMQVVVVKWGDRYSANHVNNTLLNLQKMVSFIQKFLFLQIFVVGEI